MKIKLNKISEKKKNDKHLKSLKEKASRLIAKCEDQGYEFTELQCAAITNIGEAEKYGDVNWLAENRFIELCEEWKIK